jgi:hypothetical protein
MADEELQNKYPGVPTAFEFVLPSYGWMLSRFESADARIQALQVFAATVSIAVPGAVKALNSRIAFSDWRFVLASLLFAALMIVGLFGRLRGGVMLANPRIHQERWLHWNEWEFKKNAVFWAAEHFRVNAIQIQQKSKIAGWMTGLFLVELVLLFAWFATAPPI